MSTRKLLIMFLLSATTVCSYAQVQKDAALWLSYGLDFKYKKKWKFSVSPELRFNNNMTHFNRAMVDLGAEYKPLKYFSAEISYRTSARSQDEWTDFRERIQFGVGIKQEWRAFTFSYQPRYQASLQQVSSDGDADFETTFRNKLSVKYDINKKLSSSTSFELFNNSEQGMEFRLENWRWKAGIGYSINKRNSIDIGYMIQKAIYQSPQEMDYVVMISYANDINLSKKKAKETTPPVPPAEGE